METLSMTKRFRTNENAEYQSLDQSIQKIKEKSLKEENFLSNMTNNPPKYIDTKRLLNRPSTTSHVYGSNSNSKNSKSNPNVLYSKFLMHQPKNYDNKTSMNASNVSIINQKNSNIADSATRQPGYNLINGSNQSSLNSDVFVDRLSDQRIFNRQFKIQTLVDNPGNKSARTVGSAAQNFPTKTKQQFYNQSKSRNIVLNSAQPKIKREKEETPNQINKNSNYSTLSSKNTENQSNSVNVDYKSRKTTNSSSVYYNLASARNPVIDEPKNIQKSSKNRKFVGFNLNESSNLIRKPRNHFEDNVFTKSTESFNDIYFSAPSGVFYEQKSVDRIDKKQKSEFTQSRNNSPLPTESPAIVNLLLNNQNKLYESSKLVYDNKKYHGNRLRLNDAIGEKDERNDESLDKFKKGSRDNERSLDKCTDDYDPNESALIATVNKKCNEWLEKHVIPNLESHSNTSSPSLSETIN